MASSTAPPDLYAEGAGPEPQLDELSRNEADIFSTTMASQRMQPTNKAMAKKCTPAHVDNEFLTSVYYGWSDVGLLPARYR